MGSGELGVGGKVVRRRLPEERYRFSLRKQEAELQEFAAGEIQWAEDLMYWYKLRGEDIPDDQYRACVFFLNKEFSRKPGALTLLYGMYKRCMNELPEVTKELAFDLLGYRFKLYAGALRAGGYDG